MTLTLSDGTADNGFDYTFPTTSDYWVYPGKPVQIKVPTASGSWSGGIAKYLARTINYSGNASQSETGFIFSQNASLTIENADGSPNPTGTVEVGSCVPMIARLTPGDSPDGTYSLNYDATSFVVTKTPDSPNQNVVDPGDPLTFTNGSDKLYLWGKTEDAGNVALGLAAGNKGPSYFITEPAKAVVTEGRIIGRRTRSRASIGRL